jgi:hypothetical protein
MTTCACRMQSYASNEIGDDVIYLSPMHITQRAIIGYDVPDTHPDLVNLNPTQRQEVQYRMCSEIMYRKGQYILRAMKKIEGNGCILAAHQFG